MHEIHRRPSAGAVYVLAAALLLAAPAAAQNDSEQEAAELEDWEREELQLLVAAVGDVLKGESMPSANPFELTPSFLKGTDGDTYVPFTLTIDPAQIASSAAVYLYVDEPPPAEAADEEEEREAVFEDAYFVDVEAGADGMVRLNRAFSAPGGDYDVYLAIRESLGEDADDDDREAAPNLLLRTRIPVPDLWTDALQTSSVLIAESVEPLSEPLTPREQIQYPYTLGTTRITPKHDRSFGKQDELSLIMLVYNPRLDAGQMPNVTVEYNFHTVTADGEEFFNKTNPQEFNAQSLPAGFSVAAGHQIVAGQSVPLSLFPAGDYRLEITVKDNEAGTNVTRNVNFTVREA